MIGSLSIDGSLKFVGGDLQLMAIGVVEVDRMGDVMVLESDIDPLSLQFFLGYKKVFPVRPQGKVGHPNDFFRDPRLILAFCGKQGNKRIAPGNELLAKLAPNKTGGTTDKAFHSIWSLSQKRGHKPPHDTDAVGLFQCN